MQPGSELELFQYAANWKRYYARFIKPHLGTRVLEVGAGIGATTPFLRDAQQQWTCIEPELALASSIADCEVRIGTTADLDPTPQFDSILYIDVLEHIEDDRAEVARAAALLHDGGRLIILAPAYQWLYSPFDEAIGHYRRYDRRSLARVMPRSLERVESRYLDSAGVLLSLGNRALLRSSMPTLRQIAIWDKLVVPLSRALDPLLLHRAGKSLLEVRRKLAGIM